MTLNEVRKRYLEFFRKRGHTVVPSASLVPENDPTTLFTGSGMQPMLPYLLGEKHPAGVRLADSQKSFRVTDIDEVGDNRHTTFFEMLGNWSLGNPDAADRIGAGYFKAEQLSWLFEFLTDEIKLDPSKLYVTVFAGEPKYGIERDSEAADIWKKLFKSKGIDAQDVELLSEEKGSETGMHGGRIFYFGAKKNWWSRAGVPDTMPVGEPGGPDSEVFYDFGTPHDERFGLHCHPNCDCGRFMEIGNSVFMEFRKTTNGFEKLAQRNIDFGGGLERITAASLGNPDVFTVDVFSGIIKELEKQSVVSYDSADAKKKKSFRIIADHFRAVVFMLADGILPSNTERGYFARRLIRRAVRHADVLGIKEGNLSSLVGVLAAYYKDTYPNLRERQSEIEKELAAEESRFRETLRSGLKEFQKFSGADISGRDAFTLFSSYGFPIDMTVELAAEKGHGVDLEAFNEELKKHQEISRAGADRKFKGGLADTSAASVRYHTATHLLHQALRDVLGPEVRQKGSNITPERLRFDFAFPRKMTEEEKKRVEDIVNEKIEAALPVRKVVLPFAEAEKTGALHFFGEKYSDQVNVYYIGDTLETAYSKEFCGGPHVGSTSEIGRFRIAKEEAVSAGVRRIKATVE